MIWLAVAVGGALGSAARHGAGVLFNQALGRPGPYATATVNILGSFAIGLLAGLIAHGRLHETPTMRAFVFVGVLGGFTTFSSVMLDTFTLAEGAHVTFAVANVAGQVLAGYAAAHVGFRLGA